MNGISKILDEIDLLLDQIKERNMIYQAGLKDEVADELAIPVLELYTMSYKCWEIIRGYYLERRSRE